MKLHRTAAVLCTTAAIAALAAPAYATGPAGSPGSRSAALSREAELPFTKGSAELTVDSDEVAVTAGASGEVNADDSVRLDVDGRLTASAEALDGGTAALADFRMVNRTTGAVAAVTDVRVDLATGAVIGRIAGGTEVALGSLDPSELDVDADGAVDIAGAVELSAEAEAQLRAALDLDVDVDLDLRLDLDLAIDVKLALRLGLNLRLDLSLGSLLDVRLRL